MTLAETCDVAHVLLAERVERDARTDLQIVATMAAAGARDLEIPDIDAELAALDGWLFSDPEHHTADPRAVILRALHLGGE